MNKKNKKTLLFALLVSLSFPVAANAQNDQMNASDIQAIQQEKVQVHQDIFTRTWNKPPFPTKYFTYSDKQLRDHWDYLMRGMKMPLPTLSFIKYLKKHYPDTMKGVSPELVNNPKKYQTKILQTARDYFAGRYQKTYVEGKKLGTLGIELSALAETSYASYLATRQSVKYQFLQDVVNTYDGLMKKGILQKMAKDKNPKIRANAAFGYLGYTYSLARISEESSIPVVLARGYLKRLQKYCSMLLEIYPNHPLGLGLRAGIDANIMRRVGKFNGRVTYGARTAVAIGDFEKSIKEDPTLAIIQYEYANALIYMNQKRDLNKAMRHMETAIRLRPSFAFAALQSMYAYKRLQEIRLYALDYRSFSTFDKDRRNFIDITDRNLNNVTTPNLTLDMLKHPEKYKLPPVKD